MERLLYVMDDRVFLWSLVFVGFFVFLGMLMLPVTIILIYIYYSYRFNKKPKKVEVVNQKHRV